jgi:multicomponent Na+:H+ antiporter subunit D
VADVQDLAPLAITAPLVVSCLLIAAGGRLPRPARDGVAVLTAAGVTAIDGVLLAQTHGGRVVTWAGGWTPEHGVTVGVALVADPLGVGLALVAGALITCALLYSWRYFDDVRAHYHVLFLLFLAGMTGFTMSGDLFNMFVFFELMGAAAFALTAFKIEDKDAVQGGLNFALINSLGAYLALMGVGLLYGRTGQLGLAQLSRALAGHRADALVVTAFVLISTGWLVKAAAVPFHFWTADAEAVAPSPVCAVFSGVMVQLGVYGIARVYWTAFRGALPTAAVGRTLLVIGVATAVVGATMCVAQRNLKRLLAYSTIAHVGLLVIAVGALRADGIAGAAVYVAGLAGIKGALFLLAGILLNRYGIVDELALHGRAHPRGWLPWLFVLAGLGLAALPPFGTGYGKSLAEDALDSAGYAWAPWLFVTVSALTGGAVLRATGRIFFGLGVPPTRRAAAGSGDEMTGHDQPETHGRLHVIPMSMLGAVLVLLAGSLAVGLLPGVGRGVDAAAQRFTDPSGYAASALDGASTAPVATSSLGWTAGGVLLGVATALMAVGVAAVGLYFARLPHRLRAAVERLRPVLATLHAVHSGHIGDYVAWLAVGVAGLATLLGLPTLS